MPYNMNGLDAKITDWSIKHGNVRYMDYGQLVKYTPLLPAMADFVAASVDNFDINRLCI